jgi:hypothetical protein
LDNTKILLYLVEASISQGSLNVIKGINESIHQAFPLVGSDVGLPILQEF